MIHTNRKTQGVASRRPSLDETTFGRIAAIAYSEAGLSIPHAKSAMVHTRLARRLRALKLPDYMAYCSLVESEHGVQERREMISALTTNVSHFFREEHHFDRLREDVLPKLRARISTGGRVRMWSAGCSNGQEPYSIAMTLVESDLPLPATDLRILATDIDPKVVTFARAGRYDEGMIRGLPEGRRKRFFTSDNKTAAKIWEVNGELRDLIRFRELNLLDPWPMQNQFDVIFCRNVVIYFDEDTQERLWKRFANALAPGGWLFLGHSERVSEESNKYFLNEGMTSYRRVGSADHIAGSL